MSANQQISSGGVQCFLEGLFGEGLHSKRILSLAGATPGAIQSVSLAVALIGQGLALARSLTTRHAVKQVDRMLSNEGIDVDALLRQWVPFVVGQRRGIAVVLDWTGFEADGQTTLMLSLLTRHRRAAPLYWLTVETATLKGRCHECEYQVLVRFADAWPEGVHVRMAADRGFGDHKLYRVLTEEVKFDYAVRFRGNITVTASDGESQTAAGWVGEGGRARVLRGATVTALGCPVATVVCVQAKGMKQAWCLAGSASDRTAREPINLYAKR